MRLEEIRFLLRALKIRDTETVKKRLRGYALLAEALESEEYPLYLVDCNQLRPVTGAYVSTTLSAGSDCKFVAYMFGDLHPIELGDNLAGALYACDICVFIP